MDSAYRSPAHQQQQPTGWPLNPTMVVATEQLPGYRVGRALGMVHGFARREVQPEQPLLTGRREGGVVEAYQLVWAEAMMAMMHWAVTLGANAIVGVRYETSAPWHGMPVFMVYGTAVWVEPA